LPGSQKAITHFANRGYKIFGVSNQGGCDTINKDTSKPFKSVDEAIQEMVNTKTLFSGIQGIYFCPSMIGDYCVAVYSTNLVYRYINNGFNCRKPEIGMVSEVQSMFCMTPSDIKVQSLFVGDREEDNQCAANADIPFMWADEWRFKYGSF
jgi:D-glycero-D-manno-heptose 1,7-bisphosphate phosphatase